jgi:hypothetical protein
MKLFCKLDVVCFVAVKLFWDLTGFSVDYFAGVVEPLLLPLPLVLPPVPQ